MLSLRKIFGLEAMRELVFFSICSALMSLQGMISSYAHYFSFPSHLQIISNSLKMKQLDRMFNVIRLSLRKILVVYLKKFVTLTPL